MRRGIFHFTGEADKGKTSAALQAYPLKDTAYIYDDVKDLNIEGVDTKEFVNEFAHKVDWKKYYVKSDFSDSISEEFENQNAHRLIKAHQI